MRVFFVIVLSCLCLNISAQQPPVQQPLAPGLGNVPRVFQETLYSAAGLKLVENTTVNYVRQWSIYGTNLTFDCCYYYNQNTFFFEDVPTHVFKVTNENGDIKYFVLMSLESTFASFNCWTIVNEPNSVIYNSNTGVFNIGQSAILVQSCEVIPLPIPFNAP